MEYPRSNGNSRVYGHDRGNQDSPNDLTRDTLPPSDQNNLVYTQPRSVVPSPLPSPSTLPAPSIQEHGNPSAQSRAPEFQPFPSNNPSRLQEASQLALERPTAPHSGSFRYRGARANSWHNATHASQSIHDRSGQSTTQTSWGMPPPAVPGRLSHYYGDARDFLPPEQQQISTSKSPMSEVLESGRPLPKVLLGRAPKNGSWSSSWVVPTKHRSKLLRRDRAILPCEFSARRVSQSSAANLPSNKGSACLTDPDASRKRHAHEISSAPQPSQLSRHNSQYSQRQPKIRKIQAQGFYNANQGTGTSATERINEQGHGVSWAEPSGGAVETPQDKAPEPLATPNPPGLDHTNSLMTGRGEACPNDCGVLFPNPLTRSLNDEDNDEGVIEIPSILEPAQGRPAIIMDDNYNVYNDSLLARVAQECENGPYKNTVKAIVTYHQLGMADDLYYGGIWKGRFMVNQENIVEYHNPASSCPEYEDEMRGDRRCIFIWIRDINGRKGWGKLVGANAVVPATGMKNPSAEFEGVLDLWKYFFNRVPCTAPDVHRYAELVASQHISLYPAQIDENKPEGRLRIATAQEAATRAQSMPATVALPNGPYLTYPSSHFDLDPNLSVAQDDINMPAGELPPPHTSRMWTAIDPSRPYVSPYTNLGMYLGDVMITEGADLLAGEDMDLDTTDPYHPRSNIFGAFDVAPGPQPTEPMDLYDPYGAGAAPGTEDYPGFVDLMDFQEATSGMNSSSLEPGLELTGHPLFGVEDVGAGAAFNSNFLIADEEPDYGMFDSRVFDDYDDNDDNDVTKNNKGANETSDEGAGNSSR
ncbi:hypothetical protein GQX73_g5506 [Xylaria multiplex]|uniref:Uncharacterized protein n=1 Tax=Xylaria multiplex TaxID=323545 RepID=A0A7C8MTC7_9PEZI|nr:hypothetical protein GQX73_g5506 [Xylaria multiplex]